jgi:predicted Zn-dependent protease
MSVFQQTFDELRKEIKKIGLLVKFHEKLYELNEIEKWTSLSKKLEKLEEEAKAGLTDAVYGDWEELEKKAREMGLVFESSKKEELEKNAEQVGVAPCELYVRRRIFEYNKDKVDSEERIGSSERYTASLKESEKKEELQERLDRDKIDLEMTKKKLSNLENTLALITRIGASNEDTKPR